MNTTPIALVEEKDLVARPGGSAPERGSRPFEGLAEGRASEFSGEWVSAHEAAVRGLVLVFVEAHISSPRLLGGGSGGSDQLIVQGLQSEVVARHHVLHITTLDLGDRGLRYACTLSYLSLGQTCGADAPKEIKRGDVYSHWTILNCPEGICKSD